MIRIVGGLLLALIVSTAHADFDRHSTQGWTQAAIEIPLARHRERIHQHIPHVPKPANYPERRYADGQTPAGQVVAHPAGCPARAFCGCGVAVYIFGSPIRDLWLASNWLRRFPETAPAPGTVAARNGHVLAVISVDGTDKRGRILVTAYDPNSGHHKTRIHQRALDRRYRFVNPHGRTQRYARS